jgi:hypothetical protein
MPSGVRAERVVGRDKNIAYVKSTQDELRATRHRSVRWKRTAAIQNKPVTVYSNPDFPQRKSGIAYTVTSFLGPTGFACAKAPIHRALQILNEVLGAKRPTRPGC